MTRDSLSPAEARAALDSAGAARAHLATLGMCPPWRHGAFGAVMALLIATSGRKAVLGELSGPGVDVLKTR